MRIPRLSFLSLRRAAACAAMGLACSLAGCLLGGTGTDTENGVTTKDRADTVSLTFTGISARVVDGSGAPLKGVAINLYLPGFRPDSSLAQPNLRLDSAATLVTDSSGYATIRLRAAGKFVVEGVSAGQTVFFDTLAVPDLKLPSLFTFRTRAVKAFQGKVKLASGMRVDSGFVFVRGTGRFAAVAADGAYDLGTLPDDVGRMAVGLRFSSSPTSVRQVTTYSKPGGSIGGPVSVDTNYLFKCDEVPKDTAEKIAAAPLKADAAKPALDTSKVKSALKSCDSLTQGSLINVVTPAFTAAGQQETPLLIVKNAKPVSAVNGTRVNEAVVVPYKECVIGAGAESTSFEVQLQPAGAGSDILIKDIAEKCLAK